MLEKSVFREACSPEMISNLLPVSCFWYRGFVPHGSEISRFWYIKMFIREEKSLLKFFILAIYTYQDIGEI